MANKIHVVFPRIETLHFHKCYDGGTKYIHYLAEELARKGMEVTIITTPFKKNDYKTRFHNKVRYVFLPPYFSGKIMSLNTPYKLIFSNNMKNYLKTHKFDIFHTADFFAYSYLMEKKRKPVIFQCWGLKPFYGRESTSQKGLKALYVKLFLQMPWKYCLNNADIVFADEAYQIPMIKKLGRKHNICIMQDGVNFKDIQKRKKKF